MARWDLICFTNTGNRMIRTVMTRKTIASTQAKYDPGPNSADHRSCHLSRTHEIAM